MRKVVLETPFAGDVDGNLLYARACIRDCLRRGEAPIASHLLFTQPGILNDDIPEERTLGMKAGFAWYDVADAAAVYTDLGISRGMRAGMTKAESLDKPVELRSLATEFIMTLPEAVSTRIVALINDRSKRT